MHKKKTRKKRAQGESGAAAAAEDDGRGLTLAAAVALSCCAAPSVPVGNANVPQGAFSRSRGGKQARELLHAQQECRGGRWAPSLRRFHARRAR